MGRNSNKPMMRDTATSPRVLLETEKPSLYQSPSNHGQAMEGRGFDLGIHFHHEVSHCVWRWPQYYTHSTWSRKEKQRNIGSLGNVVFCEILLDLRVTSLHLQSPQFHLCISEMFLSVSVIVISTHNCRSVSLSGIGYVMCKVIYRFHGLLIDILIGPVFNSPFATTVWWRGTMGWLPHSELYGFVAIAIQFIIRVPM